MTSFIPPAALSLLRAIASFARAAIDGPEPDRAYSWSAGPLRADRPKDQSGRGYEGIC